MTALLWLWEHRRLSAEGLLTIALIALGYWLHEPPPCPTCAPAVQLAETDHRAAQVEAKKDIEQETGAKHKVKVAFNPKCPPSAADVAKLQAQLADPHQPPLGSGILMQPPPGVLSIEVDDSGPSSREEHAETEKKSQEDRHVELQVTPAPTGPGLPRFAVFFAPRVLPSVGLGVVGGGVRVTQDLWIELWAEPTAAALGAGVRVTW